MGMTYYFKKISVWLARFLSRTAVILLFSICVGVTVYASGKGLNLNDVQIPKIVENSVDKDEQRSLMGNPEKYVMAKELDEKSGDTKISGFRPYFIGLSNTDFQEEMNGMISEKYGDMVRSFSESIRSAEFSYEIKYDADYLTLIMYCRKYSGIYEKIAATLTLRRSDCLHVEINDVLGPNGVKIANKLINTDAKRNPAKYNNIISPISLDHDFYMEGGVFYLIFDDYEISPRRGELFTFGINIESFINCYIDKDNYYSTTNYNIKMIMLKPMADTFSYELEWNDDGKRIDIYRDSKLVTSVTIGLNSYGFATANASKRKLETHPALRNGRTYLPISFYDEILGLSYTIDADGSICFSEYREIKN